MIAKATLRWDLPPFFVTRLTNLQETLKRSSGKLYIYDLMCSDADLFSTTGPLRRSISKFRDISQKPFVHQRVKKCGYS